ncbi:alpha-amylase family glycosyl hydrolase [Propioniciclava soli]|uniref:Alpha-amylase family glycosyl hydrolase n=1 Tax=Propioniciclava soli TaxID=2775081 RepID=A0ABZ3C582_9ACTN|nr:alpha-amylase family glycosyl hydrolase [Propioniciclava soli]
MELRRWVGLGAASVLLAATPACSAFSPPEYVLVGPVQEALGCDGEDAGCRASAFTETADGVRQLEVTLPEGVHAFRLAGPDEQVWGAGGVVDGPAQTVALGGEARVRFTLDPATHAVTAAPAAPAASGTETSDEALALDALRAPLTRERFYFVMTDRFANGDPSNDAGGLAGDRLATGFDPTDKGFYHGGDLRGLIDRLDYIDGLGVTTLWLTPVFVNKPVQGEGADASAGYHGYWITDFTRIDPHLGTNEEMRELIDAAHARGIKVFLDIITNHTADVIARAEGRNAYVGKAIEPYTDAAGEPFDDRDFINAEFPELDAETSFPYTPVFPNPEDATVKVPGWLNDPTLYHNRGNSTYSGESDTYGDFAGLDDLFTERREVVDGMSDIYASWIGFGVDGFRIDTVKHVNLEFWQQFGPRMADAARTAGNDDFFMFAEVYDTDPAAKARFTTTGSLPAALDFGFQAAALSFAQGRAPADMAELWEADDFYTDADSNAYANPTFLGNHDMGRLASLLRGRASGPDDLLARVELAHDLMFWSRGQPVVYYGDEQGLAGSGGDKDARQDLFATAVAQYADEEVVGGTPGAQDRYDPAHPLYAHIAALAELRERYPPLADGAQIPRHAGTSAGILAFSRIDAAAGVEYVVALNNSERAQDVTVDTWSTGVAFSPLYGSDAVASAGPDGQLTVTVPPLGSVVYRADAPMPTPDAAPAVALDLAPGTTVERRAEIAATVESPGFAQVSFWARPLGASDWTPIGTDDHAPFRVFHDTGALPAGSLVEYRAVAHDLAGQYAAASTWATVG